MATATMAADTGQKAGFWIRAIAYLIDAVILLVVQYILSLVLRDAAGIVSFVVGIAYFVLTGFFTPALLVIALAFPRLRAAIAAFAKPRPAERPAHYPELAWPLYLVHYAFLHNRRFGLLLLVGLVADVAIWLLVV